MSDLAYFEYATVIPPVGNQRKGTPVHYLVEVLIYHPKTDERRGERQLKHIAIDCLTLVLGYLDAIPGLKSISAVEAQKLRRVRSVGLGYDRKAFLVE
jgi:hypothetical protein